MQLPYYNPSLSREAAGNELSRGDTQDVSSLLKSTELRDMANNGDLTFGMIRPGLERAVLDSGTRNDQEIADMLESEIQNLAIVVKFSVVIDDEAINAFYDGPPKYESMLPKPARDPSFANRWEEFSHLMTSGPATVLLMQARGSSAVETWRSQLGHWNIEAHRDPATIRGRHAVDNDNNLVHGSDSPESVIRETDIIVSLLSRRIAE